MRRGLWRPTVKQPQHLERKVQVFWAAEKSSNASVRFQLPPELRKIRQDSLRQDKTRPDKMRQVKTGLKDCWMVVQWRSEKQAFK